MVISLLQYIYQLCLAGCSMCVHKCQFLALSTYVMIQKFVIIMIFSRLVNVNQSRQTEMAIARPNRTSIYQNQMPYHHEPYTRIHGKHTVIWI